MSPLKLPAACGAVDVDSQAAFKYHGVLRQWLPHGFGVFFFWQIIVQVFFFFERLHQEWFKCVFMIVI